MLYRDILEKYADIHEVADNYFCFAKNCPPPIYIKKAKFFKPPKSELELQVDENGFIEGTNAKPYTYFIIENSKMQYRQIMY